MALMGPGQKVQNRPLSKDKDAPGPRDWRPNIPNSGSRQRLILRGGGTGSKNVLTFVPLQEAFVPGSPAGRLQGRRAGGAGSGEACVWKDRPPLLQVSPFIPNEENGRESLGGFYLVLMVLFQLRGVWFSQVWSGKTTAEKTARNSRKSPTLFRKKNEK